jgi:dTDP-4-dehydrorhamnose 3,5-epimerase
MNTFEISKTNLDGVLSISPPTNFEDHRGKFLEIYNKEIYNNAGLSQDFIQDDISTSHYNVLRGIHGDEKTWKLVSCLFGSVYLIVVNNIANSSQYRKWVSFTLSENDYRQILIPPNFGNGHLVLSSSAIFHYKQTANYDRDSQFTISWNDPEYNFIWPNNNPITSTRDAGL